MADSKQLAQTLDLCLRVGELLLSCGAGAADVTATMRSVAHAYGVRTPQVDVTFTSLAMSAQPGPDEAAVLQIRQVMQREIDYEDLTRTDHLVQEVVAGRIELKERPRRDRADRQLRPCPAAVGRHPRVRRELCRHRADARR